MTDPEIRQKIRDAWDDHDERDPRLPTETLITLVCNDTGADWEDVIETITTGGG